jgi:WD40 repeat protein
LNALTEEQFVLVLPCILSLFNSAAEVKAEALLTLFDDVAQRLGKEGSRLFLLRPLVVESRDEGLKSVFLDSSFMRKCLHRFSLDVFCDRLLPMYFVATDENAKALIGIATLLGPILVVKYMLTPLIQLVVKDTLSLESLQQVISIMGFRFGEIFVTTQLVPRLKQSLETDVPLHRMNALFVFEKVVALFPVSMMEQEEVEIVALIKKVAMDIIANNDAGQVPSLATCMRILARIGKTLPKGNWKPQVTDLLRVYLAGNFDSGVYSREIGKFVSTNFDLDLPMEKLRQSWELTPLENQDSLTPPLLNVHRPKKRSLSKRVVAPIVNTVKKISSSLTPYPVNVEKADEFTLAYTLGIDPVKPILNISNPLFARSKLSVKEDKASWNRLLSTLDVDGRDTNFRDLRLRHFMGHSGKITKLTVNEADGLLASASKDHTVKLWSLNRTYQDVEGGLDWSEASLTYSGHEHTVFDVFILDKTMASCDGDVHVWSPETGKLITLFDAKSSLVACRWVDNSFVGANQDQIVTFRDKSPVSIWKATTPPSFPNATIKQLAVDPNDRLIALGWSSGHCSLYDRRTGRSLATWKSHDGPINQISFHTSNYVVASSNSHQGIHVWNLNDLNQIRTFKGSIDVNAFAIQGDDMVVLGASASSVNFVSLTNDFRSHTAKIRTRSPLTAVSVLPVNSLFAFGCQEGEVMIYA